MKNVTACVICVLAVLAGLVIPSYSAPIRGEMGQPSWNYGVATNTLLNAVTATGGGTAVDLGMTVSSFTCSVVLGGTIPTYVVTKLIGSIDGDTYLDLATVTTTPTEYLSNGSFTGNATGWTAGAGWAYSSNNVAKTGGTGTLSQAIATMVTVPQLGERFLLNFTISGWSAGSPAVTFMGGTGSGTTVTANATYARTITTTSATGALTFTPAATGDAYTIDDIKMVRNEDGFHVVNKAVRYIKGVFMTKSGGGTDTTVTLKCTAGGM